MGVTSPLPLPRAIFSGALSTPDGGYVPANAVVSEGWVTLWALAPVGWRLVFRAPAQDVIVRSSAQNIRLSVGGQKHLLLADPSAVTRALGYSTAGAVAGILDRPGAGLQHISGRSGTKSQPRTPRAQEVAHFFSQHHASQERACHASATARLQPSAAAPASP